MNLKCREILIFEKEPRKIHATKISCLKVFKAQSIKKLSNTEAKLRKGVASKKRV